MNRHFAALGDVWKHLTLTEILRVRPPKQYWETHAGSVSYPLTESETRLHGALYFLSKAPGDTILAACNYLRCLRADSANYPGSSSLAIQTLGAQAAYLLCDTDLESVESLQAATVGLNAEVLRADGVSVIAEAAQETKVDPQDILVHIDPFDPQERLSADALTPIELAGMLAKEGYRLFYWYGYDSVDERGWAVEAIRSQAPESPLWCGDVLIPSPFVYPGRPGAWGCGIVLANATPEERHTCVELGKALERIYADDVLPENDPSAIDFKVIGQA